MFTRCPECRTVFHITAAELRAANGTVVCGACDTTFDALDSLSETRPADARPDETDAALEDDAEPDSGLAARDEDEFLEELESLIGDDDMPDELPRREGPNSTGVAALPEPAEPAEPAEWAEPAGRELPPADDKDDTDDDFSDPESVFRVDDSADSFWVSLDGPFVGEDEGPSREHPADEAQPSAAPAGKGPGAAAPAGGPAGFDAGEEEPGEQDDADDGLPGFVQPGGAGRAWLRVVVPVVAVLFLAGTWAHVQRGKLLRRPAGQAVLGPIYSVLGVDVAPDWRPSEFRVLRSEAIATVDQSGNLNVAVEFQNGAEFAQPYPDIRIVLQDRFGQNVATHTFTPEQYLERPAGGARLAAGERMRTSVSMPDPGARADGFRVDLCLELDARGMVCAAEPFR